MSRTLTLAIPPHMADLGRVQATIVAFAETSDIPMRIQQALDLACDEVISNIILHGFDDDQSDKRIACEASMTDEVVAITFIDNGRPFDPLSEAPTPDLESSLEDRAVGGLGVHLVKALVDRCSYDRSRGDNRLTLEWSIDATPATTDQKSGA